MKSTRSRKHRGRERLDVRSFFVFVMDGVQTEAKQRTEQKVFVSLQEHGPPDRH